MERPKQITAKYIDVIIHNIKIIALSIINIFDVGVITSFNVVADHTIVKKIVKFLKSATRRGWTNFTGVKVKIIQTTITIILMYACVPKIKKYKTAIFQTAGKPLK